MPLTEAQIEAFCLLLEDERPSITALLAPYAYPREDMGRYGAELDRMAGTLRLRLGGAASPGEIVEGMAEYLPGELRFDGDRENYYDSQNSYLNRVLDRR